MTVGIDVVIPTIGRPSLDHLLASLACAVAQSGSRGPERVIVVDDRPHWLPPLDVADHGLPITVLASGGRGPAAARNAGWNFGGAEWVAFLDDDVTVSAGWWARLHTDLTAARDDVAGSQGRICVPLPGGRPATDFERSTAALAGAAWITADMAYRRSILLAVSGFDERFPRAFREDADIALRVLDGGWSLTRGERLTYHPVRPADWWVSLRQQRGNADDVLMRRLHGRQWRRRANALTGRRPQHLLTAGCAIGAGVAVVAGRPGLARALTVAWAANTAEFAWRRIAPGPRDVREVLRMISTSVLIPPAASWHWVRAVLAVDRRPWPVTRPPAAVLFDRDGTLVEDVAYNGDPAKVRPVAGAAAALARIRAAGVPIAVISNQSGVARGLISAADVDAVNAEIERQLGRFDGWFVCHHADGDGCTCRKPAAGLVLAAAHHLDVDPRDCVVIGDIGSDVAAAAAAGASSVLVPTSATLPAEVDAAPRTAPDLATAVSLVLAGGPRDRRVRWRR
jgi:histidinol-phosphate phosphatase family protein